VAFSNGKQAAVDELELYPRALGRDDDLSRRNEITDAQRPEIAVSIQYED